MSKLLTDEELISIGNEKFGEEVISGIIKGRDGIESLRMLLAVSALADDEDISRFYEPRSGVEILSQSEIDEMILTALSKKQTKQ